MGITEKDSTFMKLIFLKKPLEWTRKMPQFAHKFSFALMFSVSNLVYLLSATISFLWLFIATVEGNLVFALVSIYRSL